MGSHDLNDINDNDNDNDNDNNDQKERKKEIRVLLCNTVQW